MVHILILMLLAWWWWCVARQPVGVGHHEGGDVTTRCLQRVIYRVRSGLEPRHCKLDYCRSACSHAENRRWKVLLLSSFCRQVESSSSNYCILTSSFNPLDFKGNYSATSNNTKLVDWPLMGGLLHLVQGGGAWAGCIAIWWSVALRL